MRLSMLRESIATTTGAIAVGPMAALSVNKNKKKKKDKKKEELKEAQKGANTKSGYMGITKRDQPINQMTKVWTPFKSKSSGESWEKKYAQENDPDERLLKNFRGQGY